jgi:2-polyprenyl-3-methyl-5-hydroxy-6-metoxy-1,4-benzoquinol methylase
MPEVDEHIQHWDREWDWSMHGEEWSRSWGGTPALWFAAILPRIHAWVPAASILEIAPGHGRWTEYLKDLTDHLVIVDLAESCIEHCRRRFADASNIEYHVNDGRSLGMVTDRSVDFVFSFDSLVHAEDDVLGSYLDELSGKLTANGVAFLHHSNIGSYPALTALARRAPGRYFKRLVRLGAVIDLSAWRAESVTAARFAELCDEAGLICVSQELITWEFGPYLIDALSVVTPPGSKWERPRTVVPNRGFRREVRRMARLYGANGADLGNAG